MKSYAVVMSYVEKTKTVGVAKIVHLDDNTYKVLGMQSCKMEALPQLCGSIGLEPLNFSIENGRVMQDRGVFKRLVADYPVFVVIAEVLSRSWKPKWYILFDCQQYIIRVVKRDELWAMYEKCNRVPILQNAIFRGSNQIASYKDSFIKIIDDKPKKQKKESRVLRQQSTTSQEQKKSVTTQSKKPDKYERKAQELFGDASFLVSGLNDEQKNILVRAKKNGAPVERFNNPKIPANVMKFYGDHISNEKIADMCQPIIDNPGLDERQVNALFQCVASGVDLDGYTDGSKTANDIRIHMVSEQLDLNQAVPHVPPVDEDLMLATEFSRSQLAKAGYI